MKGKTILGEFGAIKGNDSAIVGTERSGKHLISHDETGKSVVHRDYTEIKEDEGVLVRLKPSDEAVEKATVYAKRS